MTHANTRHSDTHAHTIYHAAVSPSSSYTKAEHCGFKWIKYFRGKMVTVIHSHIIYTMADTHTNAQLQSHMSTYTLTGMYTTPILKLTVAAKC